MSDTAKARLSASFDPLTEAEIIDFYNEIDKEKKGFVTFTELSNQLERVLDELSPDTTSLSLVRLPRLKHRDVEALETGMREIDNIGLFGYVQTLFPGCESKINRDDFIAHVRSWNVPSQSSTLAAEHQLSLSTRLRARWSVDGPRIAFIVFIVALQTALALWQMVKYIKYAKARDAFGWGIILSKTAAGAIYPTMFFLLLSMSRYFATFIRRFRHVPRIINWDRSQSTHIWMAIAGLALSTLHAIGYLAGSFVHGSQERYHAEVMTFFEPKPTPKTYVQFLRILPGWTGLTALGLFWAISILSLPMIRSWSWELFQLGHVLMFPFLGLLCAHGTQKIFQYPMLGFWLAIPLFLVLLERSSRLAHGLRRVRARLELLDQYTVTITFKHPRGNWWNYEAGQYIFLQVPSISFWQWHPFTVSSCNGKFVQVHIQSSGNWTKKLRTLSTEEDIIIGVDGPFGAPAQRFYEFERAIVLGAGVGITPFSAIMTDLEQKLANSVDPWRYIKHTDQLETDEDKIVEAQNLPESMLTRTEEIPRGPRRAGSTVKRRVDFHWIVREKEDLLWFSTLLNRAYDLSSVLPSSSLELGINTYITTKRKDLSTHVFRYLLDTRRTENTPYSALTGLKMRSRLGRPNLETILSEYHNEMKRRGWTGGRVGVFFCGNPRTGRVLANTCKNLTATSRSDGSKIRYIFMMEVFG